MRSFSFCLVKGQETTQLKEGSEGCRTHFTAEHNEFTLPKEQNCDKYWMYAGALMVELKYGQQKEGDDTQCKLK